MHDNTPPPPLLPPRFIWTSIPALNSNDYTVEEMFQVLLSPDRARIAYVRPPFLCPATKACIPGVFTASRTTALSWG